MAKKKTTKKSAAPLKSTSKKSAVGSDSLLGLPAKSFLTVRKAKGAEARTGKRAFIIALGSRDAKKTKAAIRGHLNAWQTEQFAKNDAESVFYQGTQGPIVILRPPTSNASAGTLPRSSYARLRDHAGQALVQMLSFKVDKLVLEFHELGVEEEHGALVGLEIAAYSYSENRPESAKARKKLPTVLIKDASDDLTDARMRESLRLGHSVNIARHLVNIPGGQLNPRTYSDAVEDLFKGSATVSVDVWKEDRLRKENMNLLLAVGGGAVEQPRLVRMSYRPKNTNAQPIAIVGKGITFDSGGLDIKPSSAMRWMKKDMGGSAAVVGIMRWAEQVGLPVPLDGYLSLAENSVSSNSFRPGDVITARNGLTIEIHNTDAEGRLALADALDVAVTQSEKPSCVIDLATLTGAIKVGLGADIAGLFCNNDVLAETVFEAGADRGDLCWPMPLFQSYKSLLRSNVADYANASDGFAGAITAALFLEFFVKDIPWAHLDIYAWKDAAGGPYAEGGGNGQPVQALAEFLTRVALGGAEWA